MRRISAAPGQKDQQRAGIRPQCPHDRLGDLPLDWFARIAPDIARLDREGAAGALDHFRTALRPTKKLADACAVERRRHDQKLEVLAQTLLDVASQREAEIGVERALVELVEQDGGDARERGVVEHHAREDPLGHDLDAGRARDLGAEADAVAHRRADRLAECRRHARRRGAGRKPARLQHEHLLALGPWLLGQNQRHPRGLAGAGRSDQDRGAVRAQGGGQFRQRFVDG